MKAIIIGAGRIGRGFVTQLLVKNGVEVVFFDNSPALVDLLNQYKHYTVRVMGYPQEDTLITGVRAYSVSDIKQLSIEWADADYVMTAVGGKNLTGLGTTLAQAYQLMRGEGYNRTSNIITCENWIDPAADLKNAIDSTLTGDALASFHQQVGISEGVILTTGAGSPDGKIPANPCDTWVQNFKYLPIDKAHLLGTQPTFAYIELVDNFGDLLKQKLYTNNTSVGLIAFLGYLKGLKYVADAANDPEIEPILDLAYDEINDALINGLGINAQSQYAFSKRAKNKYQDRNIVDLITRIARDPIRKLAPTDRLIGPAKILLSIGREPKAITLAIAAALYYDDPDDEIAVKLATLRKQHGVDAILTDISGLDKHDHLISLVHKAINELKQKGWIKEN